MWRSQPSFAQVAFFAAALALGAAVEATVSTAASTAVSFDYPQHGTMDIALVGDNGDAARVVFTPTGANASFLRYQGYINQSALTTTESFTVTKGTSHTILSRGGWSLNVSHDAPTVALTVGGVVVSRDASPPARAMGGAACDPPNWHGLPCVNDPANGKNCRSGIGMTVATDSGGCLRGARSLASTNVSGASIGVGISNEQIFGFGQTVTQGLSAVGSTKFIATFSRTLSSGPSHAPAPFYISLASDPLTNKSLAHGFFLNTHGYSAFDLGATTPAKLAISSPVSNSCTTLELLRRSGQAQVCETALLCVRACAWLQDPVFDYFLFAGPTPAAVIGQFATVAGGRMALPPKWAMGMKYDPQENGDNVSHLAALLCLRAARPVSTAGAHTPAVDTPPSSTKVQLHATLWSSYPDPLTVLRGVAVFRRRSFRRS